MQTFRYLWDSKPSQLPDRLPMSGDLCIQVFVSEVFSIEVDCLLSSEETTQLSTMTELSKAQGLAHYPDRILKSKGGFAAVPAYLDPIKHAWAPHESAWRQGEDIYLTYSWKYSPTILQDAVKMCFGGSFEAGMYTFWRLSCEAATF